MTGIDRRLTGLRWFSALGSRSDGSERKGESEWPTTTSRGGGAVRAFGGGSPERLRGEAPGHGARLRLAQKRERETANSPKGSGRAETHWRKPAARGGGRRRRARVELRQGTISASKNRWEKVVEVLRGWQGVNLAREGSTDGDQFGGGRTHRDELSAAKLAAARSARALARAI